MADRPSADDIANLEAEVLRQPHSEAAREDLLMALAAEPEWFDDPRRFELIGWFLEHNPRHPICTTPLAVVNPATAPDAYRTLKARWLDLVAHEPDDPQLVRGAAAFVAAESLNEGTRLLKAAVARKPDDATLWLDLGRMSQEPRERLAAFERTKVAGGSHPNLLVWTAMAAFEAGADDKAATGAHELIRLVNEAQVRFGDNLNWPERGAALWNRALQATSTKSAASELVNAIGEHAYRKHWAHTVFGLLACRRNDLDGALSHLRASADIRPDHRISAYGPSLDLLRELCLREQWDEGLRYLQAWDHPRLDAWMAAVEEHRVPETDRTS